MSDFTFNLEVKIPTRLDLALLDALRINKITLSRANLKSAFQENKIFFHGSLVKPSFILSSGTHQILWKNWNPEPEFATPLASPSIKGCFLDRVYEDDDMLVLNKTAHTPSIPHKTSETETAVGAALAHYPLLSEVGRKGLEPGIIHRLDTETSGLIVFAKTQTEFERLSLLWKNRQIKKYYKAIVDIHSPLPRLPLRIDFPLAHDANSSKRMVPLNRVTKTPLRGKPLPAVTHILNAKTNKTLNTLELTLEIETGVMHQIRCHLSALGWPIVGDKIYNKNKTASPRLCLHAWRLTLPNKTDPNNPEKNITLEAPLPSDWPKN